MDSPGRPPRLSHSSWTMFLPLILYWFLYACNFGIPLHVWVCMGWAAPAVTLLHSFPRGEGHCKTVSLSSSARPSCLCFQWARRPEVTLYSLCRGRDVKFKELTNSVYRWWWWHCQWSANKSMLQHRAQCACKRWKRDREQEEQEQQQNGNNNNKPQSERSLDHSLSK